MTSRGQTAFLAALDARVKLACLIVFVVVALHARSALALGLCVVAASAYAAFARMRFREALRVLKPLGPILVITVIAHVLYVGQGSVRLEDVIAWVGPVAITHSALAESARMVASLFCIMLASVSFMRVVPTEELVRTLRWLLSPLRKAGLRVDAFMLSLSVAFRFVPILLGDFRRVKAAQQARAGGFDGTVRQKLTAYMRLFGPLLRSSYRRADVVAEAFLARCFSCRAEASSLHAHRISAGDAATFAVCIAFCSALYILG